MYVKIELNTKNIIKKFDMKLYWTKMADILAYNISQIWLMWCKNGRCYELQQWSFWLMWPGKVSQTLQWRIHIHIYTSIRHFWLMPTQIAKVMGSTWGPPGSCWPQMGPMNLAIRVMLPVIEVNSSLESSSWDTACIAYIKTDIWMNKPTNIVD